ncbi:zinc knuckle CX2CX4HX4C containing protein [Tanacetum coccineum]|uniref:Zinc knuckle CX2CX4HX4C containing protein n=1 Tax=Tanacetum coccineum TaxID=301880 RepID=A0ABQ5IYM3_9ASTR
MKPPQLRRKKMRISPVIHLLNVDINKTQCIFHVLTTSASSECEVVIPRSSVEEFEKREVNSCFDWVKLHDFPMSGFTIDGLSAIATKIGKPLMLDSFTSTMCNESGGRNSYAYTIIEVSVENTLKDSMVIDISNLENEGYMYEIITIEYQWTPPRCANCKIFGHDSEHCPKIVHTKPVNGGEVNSSGRLKMIMCLHGANGGCFMRVETDVNELAHEHPTSNVAGVGDEDSDNEVEEVVNEPTSFMASKSGGGIGRKSLYERWKDDYEDNPYDDDD